MDEYVVYLKRGNLEDLGKKKKSIWKILGYDGYEHDVKLKNIVTGDTFTTAAENIITVKKLINSGKFKPQYFNSAAFSRYEHLIREEIKELEDKIKDHNWDNSKYINHCSEVFATSKLKSKEITMENKVKKVVNTNVDAAKVAASITAGKTLNKVVADKVTPQLPMLVRGYANTALGRVVIANIADFAVKQFLPTNEKAQIASKAMMEAAMVELLESFDFESIVNDIVSSVELPVTE